MTPRRWSVAFVLVLAAASASAQDADALLGTWTGSVTQQSGTTFRVETHIWRGTGDRLCALAIYPELGCHGELVQTGSRGGTVEFFEALLPRSSQCLSFAYTTFVPAPGGVERASRPLLRGAASRATLARAAAMSPTLAERLGRRVTGEPEPAALPGADATPAAVRAFVERLTTAPGEALILSTFPADVAQVLAPPATATTAAIDHLAWRVPELTEVAEVLRFADLLAWRMEADVRGLYGLQQQFEGAVAAVRASARDTAVVAALRRHVDGWRRAQQRAAGGCDATVQAAPERIVALATSSEALRGLMQASAQHAALLQQLQTQQRGLPQRHERGHADHTLAQALDAIRSAITASTAEAAGTAAARTLARQGTRLPAPDIGKHQQAIDETRREDDASAPGFDDLQRRGLLGARLLPLERIVRAPPPAHMLSMLRRAIAAAAPGDPLQQRLQPLESAAAAVVGALDADETSETARATLQDPEDRARLDALARRAAGGDKAALRQLEQAAAAIAGDRVLPQVAALAPRWRALLVEVQALGERAAAVRAELQASPLMKSAWAALRVEQALADAQAQLAQARERHREERAARRAAEQALLRELDDRDRAYEECRSQEPQCVAQDEHAFCVRWVHPNCEW